MPLSLNGSVEDIRVKDLSKPDHIRPQKAAARFAFG